jgi:diaminobutyrate-2-oxoglutarate transaminase
VRDTDGREYVDCLAGAGALPLGHNHPVVVSAVERALRDDVPLTTLDLPTPTKDEFVEQLFAVLPPRLAEGRIQFCSPSGADAVEAALKLAKTATRRSGVVTFGGGYHGMTHGALAVTGAVGPKAPLGPLVADVHHLPFPTARTPIDSELCTRVLQWALHDDHSGITPPAAAIVEPVQGEGGVHAMPEDFAHALRTSTRTTGSVLIADEVQTGLGRTGTLWASTPLGLDPDVMVLSKAIGGGLPLAVIVYRAELDLWGPGAHSGTFRGNQLAMAAGTATIAHVVAERLDEHAAAMGARLVDGLRQVVPAGYDAVGDIRGSGLMVGVEMVDPDKLSPLGVPEADGKAASVLQHGMLRRGVIVEVGGRAEAVLRFLPPLIVEPAQIDRIVDTFADALRDL